MFVNTRRLFLGLLHDLDIQRICDVGSMDGSEALSFHARVPRARILALEPHPENFARMLADPRLCRAGIDLICAAATDAAGRAPFFLVPAGDGEQARARRGMSSLLQREASACPAERVDVQTLRLDELLRLPAEAGERMALWIDVEGKAFEAVEGMQRIAAQVQLLHIELEAEACISPRQRLAADVHALLEQLGFEELATDLPRSNPQYNAVYLRRGQTASASRRIARRLWRARWRRRLVLALRTACPACARRLAGWRSRFDP
jgi:FkbM family methyltransferase